MVRRYLLTDWGVFAALIVICVGASEIRDWLPIHVANRETLYATTATVAATLLGFLIAATAILVSRPQTAIIAEVERRGLYERALRLFNQENALLAVTTLVALAGISIDQDPRGPLNRHNITSDHYWIWLVTWIGGFTAWRLFRCLVVMSAALDLQVRPGRRHRFPTQSAVDSQESDE